MLGFWGDLKVTVCRWACDQRGPDRSSQCLRVYKLSSPQEKASGLHPRTMIHGELRRPFLNTEREGRPRKGLTGNSEFCVSKGPGLHGAYWSSCASAGGKWWTPTVRHKLEGNCENGSFHFFRFIQKILWPKPSRHPSQDINIPIKLNRNPAG